MGDFLRDQQQYLSSTDTEYLSIEKRANYVTRLLAGLSSGEDIADEDEHAPAPDQIRGGGETDDDEDDLNDVGTRDDEELDVEVRAGEEEIAGGDEYEYKYYSDGDENSSDGVDYRPAYDEDKQLSEAMRDSYIESVESVLDHNRKNSESNDGTPSMPAGDASPASGQQACLVQNPRTCGLLNFGNNCYVSYSSCPCPFIISSTSFSQPHRSQKKHKHSLTRSCSALPARGPFATTSCVTGTSTISRGSREMSPTSSPKSSRRCGHKAVALLAPGH